MGDQFGTGGYWAPSKTDEDDPDSAIKQITSWFRKRDNRLPTYSEGPEIGAGEIDDPTLADYAEMAVDAVRNQPASPGDRPIEGTNVAQTRGVDTRVQQGQAEYTRPEVESDPEYQDGMNVRIIETLKERGFDPGQPTGSFGTLGPKTADAMNDFLISLNWPFAVTENTGWDELPPELVDILGR